MISIYPYCSILFLGDSVTTIAPVVFTKVGLNVILQEINELGVSVTAELVEEEEMS